jgi:hypothetical protein
VVRFSVVGTGGSVPRIKLPLQHVVPRLRMSGDIPPLPHTPSGRGQGLRPPHRNRDNCKGTSAYYISCCLISKGLRRTYGTYQQLCVGRDRSVDIVTRYGLAGRGIETRWGRDFPHLSRQALGHTQFLVLGVPGHSRG